MSWETVLNEDQRDALQELMNISYGSATAAIAQIIDKHATLAIPKIQTATIDEFRGHIQEEISKNFSCFITNQQVNGTLSGEVMFIIGDESAHNLAYEFDLEEDEIDEDELKDVVLEISNIICSTTISKLSELMETTVSFSPPNVKILDNINGAYETYTDVYSHIIIISTSIEFAEQNIVGELIILSKDDSINFIKQALDKILEEF